MPAPKKIKINRREKTIGTRFTAQFLTEEGQWLSAGTHDTYEDAYAAAKQRLDEAGRAGWVDPRRGEISLADYAEQKFFPNKAGVEPQTLAGYRSAYNNHIKPRLGKMPIGHLLPSDVGGWIRRMEDDRVGRPTQWLSFRVLGMILGHAVNNDVIAANATEKSGQPLPQPEHEVSILYPGQWDPFIAAVPEVWRPVFQVLFRTGLRLGEVRGLTAPQIKWETDRILVDRAINQSSRKSSGNRFLPKDYPKGRRSRSVPADSAVLSGIQADLAEWSAMSVLGDEILRRGISPEDPVLVLTMPDDGSPLAEEVVLDVMVQACEDAGIPRHTPKDLRSTFASWRLRETGDLTGVQRELGHRDIDTTQRYLTPLEHWNEGDPTNVVDAFEAFMRKRRAS